MDNNYTIYLHKLILQSTSTQNNKNLKANIGVLKFTYNSLPSAGPALSTSEMAIDGSPLAKCGLSLPPLTAIPNPNPVTCNIIQQCYNNETH